MSCLFQSHNPKNDDIYIYVHYIRHDWRLLEKIDASVINDEEIELLKTNEKIMLHVVLGNYEKIKDYTIEDYKNCISIDEDPIYFLIAWCDNKHSFNMLEHLLSKGMTFCKTNKFMSTLYHISIIKNNVDIIKFLETKCPQFLDYYYESKSYPSLCDYFSEFYGNTLYECILDPYNHFCRDQYKNVLYYVNMKPWKEFKKITKTFCEKVEERNNILQKELTFNKHFDIFIEKNKCMINDKRHKYEKKSCVCINECCVICEKKIETKEYLECKYGDLCHYECYVKRLDQRPISCSYIAKNALTFRCPSCECKFTNNIVNETNHIFI